MPGNAAACFRFYPALMVVFTKVKQPNDMLRNITYAKNHRRVAKTSVASLCVLAACCLSCLAQPQTNYQRIVSFGPTITKGSFLRGQLLEGADGFLYGTSYAGGSNNLGTIFKVDKKGGRFAQLHSFSDGSLPYAGLVQAADGSLYGTSAGGGSNNGGTVFTLATNGTGYQVLLDMGATNGDAISPAGGLAISQDGVLYGTTTAGGDYNFGTVFRVKTDGSDYRILYSFAGTNLNSDGTGPFGTLLLASDGAIYGTTQAGGTNGYGTIFKIFTDGNGYQVLHHFMGSTTDGQLPMGALTQDADGMLYGTTYYGGTNALGTVYKVDTNGINFALIHSFSGVTDGSQPVAGVVARSDGYLYGTARYGGASDAGMAYRMALDGSDFTVLHSFAQMDLDGAQPIACLMFGSDGAIYGSTFYGGAYLTNGVNGTIFRLFGYPPKIAIDSLKRASGNIALTFSGGAAGQTYQIQSADVIAADQWQIIGSAIAAIDGSFNYTDTNTPAVSKRFYRTLYP